MFQKDCRLARAATYYGGGSGGTDINQSPGGFRFWGNDNRGEQKDIRQGYGFQTDEFNNYVEQNPLLKNAQSGALDFWKQLPQFSNQLNQQYGNLGTTARQIGGLASSVGTEAAKAGNWLRAYVSPTIASQGAYTGQEARDIDQNTFGLSSLQGSTRDTGTLGQSLLNRDAYKQQRFNTALQQGQGLLGQQAGLQGQQAGLYGQQAAVRGQQAANIGQQQALQTGGLNQLLGVGNAAVSQFGGLTNPILSYMQGIFGGNQQAAIAQAQANAQANAASSSKTGGAIGAGGSIIGALIPVIAGL